MKTVFELSDQELQELRSNYFAQLQETGELFDGIQSPEDIPMESILFHYADIMFSSDDFFCNL